MGSAPGSFRTDCSQRCCAGQWVGFRRHLHGDPHVSPLLHRAFFSRKRREREAAPSGPRKRNQPGPEFRETGLWLSPHRPGSRLHPAACAPRTPRAPGGPPDSPSPSRGRPVGPGRGSRKARRLLGRSAPRHEVCDWGPRGGARSRALCPAGRQARNGRQRRGAGVPLGSPAAFCSPALHPALPAGPVSLSSGESDAPPGAVTGTLQPPPGSGALVP